MGQVLRQRKSEFQQRLKHGQSFEYRVETYLKSLGFLVSELNIQSLSRDHIQKVISLNDFTSLFVRYLPDRYCSNHKISFFFECKKANLNSDYFSYSLEEFKQHRKLSELMGCLILVVTVDNSGLLRSQWISKIKESDYETFNNKEYLNRFNGSQEPFIRIKKDIFPRLDSIITVINRLHASNTPIAGLYRER